MQLTAALYYTVVGGMMLGTLALLSPLLLVISPLIITAFFLRIVYIVARATKGEVFAMVKVVGVIVEELLFMVTHFPLYVRYTTFYRSGGANIIKDIPYATLNGRKVFLDVYPVASPPKEKDGHPAIVFVYGGRWASGDKTMYTLLARALRERLGAVIVVMEYEYYPKASMAEMAWQVNQAVKWTSVNAERFAIDPAKIWCVGHSAGAHLLMLQGIRAWVQLPIPEDLLEKGELYEPPYAFINDFRMKDEPRDCPTKVVFDKVNLAGYVLMNGVYDIQRHLEWETARGIHNLSPMKNATFGAFHLSSPNVILRSVCRVHGRKTVREHLEGFPPVYFLHGARDLTVPDSQSMTMNTVLQEAGVRSHLEHTIPIGHVDPVTSPMGSSVDDCPIISHVQFCMARERQGE